MLKPRAMDLLKAMSNRLAAAKTMSFTATASYERTTLSALVGIEGILTQCVFAK